MGYAWELEGLRVSCSFNKTDGRYMFSVVGDEDRVDAFLMPEDALELAETLRAWVTAKESMDDMLGELAYTAYTAAANGKAPIAWETVSSRTQQLWIAAAMAVRGVVLDEDSPHGKAARDAT